METNKRFHAIDIVKMVLQWTVVALLSYAYWVAMLLVISLVLLNVWHVSFENILLISGVLAAVTSIVYGVILIRRNI
ncbi:MAG: hypothetical protein K6A23_04855 [Butyrivibrio sp.]|nr:hypothetical protein [Butyrivibrio sp.]